MKLTVKRTSLVLVMLAAALSAGPALAQEQQEQRQPSQATQQDRSTPIQLSRDQRSLLGSRNREQLHPGNPLDLRGLEEGDNDFRARTPALLKSDLRVALVDLEEARARKRDMYELGARFDSELGRTGFSTSPSSVDAEPAALPPEAAPQPVAPPVEPAPEGWDREVLLGIAGLLALVVLFAWRRRRA